MPIVATSCNIAGGECLNNMEEILAQFEKDVDIIIDGGDARIGKPSTIVRVDGDTINVLREGPKTLQDILDKIKEDK